MHSFDELRSNCSLKQKRGIHFIIASVVIWAGVTAVHLSSLDIMTKNLLTFCLSVPLMPYSWLYRSRSYLVLSIVIPILALIVGLTFPPSLLAASMMVIEIGFVLLLAYENR